MPLGFYHPSEHSLVQPIIYILRLFKFHSPPLFYFLYNLCVEKSKTLTHSIQHIFGPLCFLHTNSWIQRQIQLHYLDNRRCAMPGFSLLMILITIGGQHCRLKNGNIKFSFCFHLLARNNFIRKHFPSSTIWLLCGRVHTEKAG